MKAEKSIGGKEKQEAKHPAGFMMKNSRKNSNMEQEPSLAMRCLFFGVLTMVSLLGVAVALVFFLHSLHVPMDLTAEGGSLAAMPENPPTISARQAILIDGKNGLILYEKNAGEKAYPASTTKIMTALIAIETLEALDADPTQKVPVTTGAIGVEGSSIYLKPNEMISIEDLLYGMMLRSGNDAAVELACIIGGTQENFIGLMNEKAREIGCRSTNFINPNGLFDENHFTTVKDMALIAAEAMKHPYFREIAAAREWQGSRDPENYNYFYNKNKVVHRYEGGNGIKIGFTKASGRTLVASAARKDTELICVVMNAPDWFNDAYALMDYGFSKVTAL